MEVNVTIDETLLSEVTSGTNKNLNAIIAEALSKWAKDNLLKCPLDDKYCCSNQPCNQCSKSTNCK